MEAFKVENIAIGKTVEENFSTHVKTKIVNSYENKREFEIILSDSGFLGDFEIPSEIVAKSSDEATKLLEFNKHYEYLTSGDGKIRPKGHVEVQTDLIYNKPKATNTEIESQEKGTFVRNFDIFDTFAKSDSNQKFMTHIQSDEELSRNRNFHELAMTVEKCLAENVFSHQVMIYKNLAKSNGIQQILNFNHLWTYKCDETSALDVVSFSWSGDLLAVAYGNFVPKIESNVGFVLIWNFKNPVNPERKYKFEIPVSDIEFSPKNLHLLAVAFHDGSLKILDISKFSKTPQIIAKLSENIKSTSAAIMSVKWMEIADEGFIFTASTDGRVMKYKIGSGGKLNGNLQIQISRIEGPVEGLAVNHKKNFVESERFAQILCMEQHPERLNEFLISTDEGCVYTCSTIFINKCLTSLQAQEKAIYAFDFSPFNSKLFLTAGSDQKIRIWMENVLEPLIELEEKFTTSQCVKWSKIYPTLIFNCSHDGIRVWDLRKKAEKPIHIELSTTKLTTFDFSPSGTSLIVGDVEGNVKVFSIHNGFLPPKQNFKELKKIIYESLRYREKILHQVKQIFISQKFSSKIDAQ